MTVRSHAWYHQRHHRPRGFQNIWGPPRDVPFFKAASWMARWPFRSKENVPPPVRAVDAARLSARPDRMRLTWLGHAALFIQTPTLDILTDPMLGERASPFSFMGPERAVAVPLELDDLPGVDLVLISHDHYDHLDAGSIRRLARRFAPRFVAPLGVAPTLRGWGAADVVEMDWWQYADTGDLRLHCTPAKHFSGRGLANRDETLWASYYLEPLGGSAMPPTYFGADSAYAGHFAEIKERLGTPHVALLPIGAYRPRWFMEDVHVEPAEAVQAFLDLGAEHLIPIHWGTFDLADEPIDEPPALARQHAAAAGLDGRFHLLDIGETFDV